MIKENKDDLITIVVPVYNVEKYIKRCIDSIVKQTYQNIEIILVNDGSPDNCGVICNKYAEHDSRIHVIHKTNGGLSSARNAGLEMSHGEYIVFIDSDDWIEENYIEKLYKDIIQYKSDIACPGFCLSYDNGRRIYDCRIKNVTSYTSEEALEIFLFNGYLTPCVASKMWKKELWSNIRCPMGVLFEDQYTTYKLLMRANKVVFDPSVNYFYFKREGSIGHSSFSNRTYDLLYGIEEEYNEITKRYPNIKDSMDVARAVWEIVFVNMMISSDYSDHSTTKIIQNRVRGVLKKVITTKFLPIIRKIEMTIFCIDYKLYKKIYIKYKAYKGIA